MCKQPQAAGTAVEPVDTAFLYTDGLRLSLERFAPADPARGWVPAYHFRICLPDGTPIGRCDLRVGYNRGIHYGGNIGYAVDAAYRGHRYAATACRLLFGLARRHGMESLSITCAPENLASRRTCELAGGRLLEIADLPEDTELYRDGQRQVCIYGVAL